MKLSITVDGTEIKANRFVRNIICDVNAAIVKSLRGVDKPGKIVMEIDLTEEED